MNQFKPTHSKLKSILVSSVAVIGLASAAQAQVAELKGLMDNKDLGGSSSFYLPLGNVETGMPFFNIGAGLLGGSKSGEALVGYGQGFGNVGVRGYAGVGLKDSHHNLFTTAKAGFELSIGGLGLNVSGSVPFGKTRQVAKQGHTDVVLVDPTGQQCDPTGACVPVPPSCSSPLPGQVRHCEIGVAVTDPSYEKALKGFEVGLDYQVQVGGVWLRPSLGYYRYGNGIVSGAKAGLEVSVPLTSQLSLNIGAGGQKAFNKGDNKALSGFGSLGISYHFGGVAVSQLSALEHRFAEAPNRNQRTLTTHTKQGNTTIYRPGSSNQAGLTPVPPLFKVIWDQTNEAISEVWLVDHSNEAMADEIVAGAKEEALVVFDGSKGDITIDHTIALSQSYQGMVGGGSNLTFKVSSYGGPLTTVNATLPGTRAKIIDKVSTATFLADTRVNPVFYNLNIENQALDSVAIMIASSSDVKIRDVELANKDVFNHDDGIVLLSSHNVVIDNIIADRYGTSILLKNSQDIAIHTFRFTQGFTGIDSSDSDNVTIQHGIIAKMERRSISRPDGIYFFDGKNTIIDDVYVLDSGEGITLNGVEGAKITNARVLAETTGLRLANMKGDILLKDIDVIVGLPTLPTTDVPTGIVTFGSGGMPLPRFQLENITINLIDPSLVSIGWSAHSAVVSAKSVKIKGKSADTAFILEKITATDLGGNTSTGIGNVCDGVADSTGSINVLNVDTGLTQGCR